MEIVVRPIVVESDTGAQREFWDWSVETSYGKMLSGIETNYLIARFFAMIACFRFMYTIRPSD